MKFGAMAEIFLVKCPYFNEIFKILSYGPKNRFKL